jgi:predicted RNA binding protein YcfA (HicA-like mRNA interferase family)
MPRAIKFKILINVLNKLGYFEERQKGSHIIFKNISGHITVVPKHSNGEVRGGTLGKILRDIEIKNDEFEKIKEEL